MKSPITTHVLDTSHGHPAAGILAVLERRNEDGEWLKIGDGATDNDGRIGTLLPNGSTAGRGTYRIRFDTAAYWAQFGVRPFHPRVQIEFKIEDPDQHYHVPLLLSPFGYTTYRGS